MNKLKHYVTPIALLVVGVLGAVGLSKLKTPPKSDEPKILAPLVETASVTSSTDGFSIEVDGEVIPFREITLAAEVPGKIVAKSPLAKAGTFVEKDTVLFEIDPRDYDLEIRRQQELVKQTDMSIEENDTEKLYNKRLLVLANEDWALQRSDVQRYVNLAKRNAGSDVQLEQAKKAEIKARNAIQTLESQISLSEKRKNRLLREKDTAITSLEKSQLDLTRTKVKAPVDGVIMQDLVEQDDFVQRGTSLLEFEDTEKVEIRFNLRMDQLRWIWSDTLSVSEPLALRRSNFQLPPLDVKVFLELDGNKYVWNGQLSRYDGAGINPSTRTVPCIATVENPGGGQAVITHAQSQLSGPPTLMRGMFVSIQLPVSTNLKLVEIPNRGFRPGSKVWAIDDGKLAIRDVRVASANQESTILVADESGLQPGDMVVTSPLPLIVDGMALRPNDEKALTASEESAEEIR